MIVVCPDCGKRFSAQPNWPDYEILVTKLCDGVLEPKGKNGNDVTGPDGIRYQVKMANERNGVWIWFGRFPNHGADFYILFRVTYDGLNYMYILTEKQWDALGKPNRKSDFILKISRANLNRISAYQCDINKDAFKHMVKQLLGTVDFEVSNTSFQMMLNIT